MNAKDERWAELWQELWNSNWTLSSTPPPFVVDPLVRRGISAILSLERIQEERQRLSKEELNARLWIAESVDGLFQIMDHIHRK